MLTYCKKCGLITQKRQGQEICAACEIPMDNVPSEYLTASGMMFISQKTKQEFEELIKQGEEFDIQASLERNDIINQKKIEREVKIKEKVSEYNKTKVKFTCPFCHSENLSKISNVGKFLKVSAFGILGAGDLGKKYKCNSCGCKF